MAMAAIPPVPEGRATRRAPALAVAFALVLILLAVASFLSLFGPGNIRTLRIATQEAPRVVAATPWKETTIGKLTKPIFSRPKPATKPATKPPRRRRWEGNGVLDDDGLAQNLFHLVFFFKDKEIPSSNLCAVESLSNSLLASNSTGMIRVWLDRTNKLPEFLTSLSNVEIRFSNLEEMIADTPLSELYHSDKNLGNFAEQNKANAIRLAAVYKHGGTYLDGDFIVNKDPSILWEGAAFEVPRTHRFNNAAFTFRRNSPHILALMKEFVAGYDGNWWGHQGPELLTRVFSSPFKRGLSCSLNPAATRVSCEGIDYDIRVWSTNTVYPLPYQNYMDLFKPANESKFITDETVMVHCWHKATKDRETEYCKNDHAGYLTTIAGALREKYCPQSLQVMFDTCHI